MVRAHKRDCVITNAVLGHARTINAIGPMLQIISRKYDHQYFENPDYLLWFCEAGEAKVPIISPKIPNIASSWYETPVT